MNRNYKTIYLLLVLFLFIISCSRADKVVERYEDGSTQAEYYVINGREDGMFKSYFKNGNSEMIGTYKEGKKQGDFKYFDSTGVKRKEARYIDDLMHGKVYDYFPNGKIAGFSTFEMGVRNGEGVSYYPNGKVRFKTSFDQGVRIFMDEYDSISGELLRWWMDVGVSHKRDSFGNHKILFTLKNKKFNYMGIDLEIYSGVYTKEGEYKWDVEEQAAASAIEVEFASDELGSEFYIEGHLLDLQRAESDMKKFDVKNLHFLKRKIQIINSDSSVVIIPEDK